jgi:EAL domain-containing protein (putative c-di-GMP-specific phosphodiesterase class I)
MKADETSNKEGVSMPNTNKLNITSMLGSTLNSVFTPKTEKDSALLWLALETDLKNALKDKQLSLNYQPIMDMQNDKIYGMEALLRWHHPEFGAIPPIDLFSVAEATGLASPIGEWVLQEACSQAVRWHELNSQVKLFINLSITQLREANFLETFHRVLNDTKIDPKLLILELPQTASLEKEDALILDAISKTGIGLSIDDFGTASSSWHSLKSFGIIKIDNTMIQMINHYQEDSTKIVSAIFAMAKSLGIKTLAEGVETEAQYQFLKDKKCDLMQGFYFSKPLSVVAFTQLLTSHQSS